MQEQKYGHKAPNAVAQLLYFGTITASSVLHDTPSYILVKC